MLRRSGFVALMVGVSLSLVSCKQYVDLPYVRQSNADLVLKAYRARPLEAATGGSRVVTLHDCRRLALKNSLDVQTAMWEEHIRHNLTKKTAVKMLPHIEGRYEVSERDRPAFSRSDVINQEGAFEVVGPGPGTGVTNWSTGRERVARRWQVEIKWSPMDAAIAGYLARINHNEAIHARYQRTRVAQQLIGTVTSAFYQLLALSKAQHQANALVANRKAVVRELDGLSELGLIEPEEVLTAKDELAEARRRATDINVQIGKQRTLLASALNICPDTCINVAGRLLPLPPYCLDPCKLEKAALLSRPEAYQADLTHFSSIEDTKRLLVKMLPRVEGFFGWFRDENKFLYYNEWADGGMRVTWDLLQFTADNLEHRAMKQKVQKTDRERALISLGILSQVRMKTMDAVSALETYNKMSSSESQSRERLRIARSIEDVKESGAPNARDRESLTRAGDTRMPRSLAQGPTRADEKSEKALMRVRTQWVYADLLDSVIDRLIALGNFHAALAELDTAVGANFPVNGAPPPMKLACPIPAKTRSSSLLGKAAGLCSGVLNW